MKSHADELLMASMRKWTNCIDFHSLTASVHMSIFKSPCGVTICNSKLLWLLELDVVLAQGLLTQTKFPWWELRLVYKLIPWLPHRERHRGGGKSFVNPQQRCHAFFFSLLGMCTLARGQTEMFMAHLVLNTSGPMCHLCFFSPGRDEIPESTVMWQGRNVPAMFCECRAEHN